MRFIATADWQLGMTAHYLDDEARPRFQRARFDAVKRIGKLAQECGAQFVVVGGDVFESNQLDRSVAARMFDALRSCPVPVVLLPGNHDPLDASSIYDSPAFTAGCPEQVVVIRDQAPITVAPGVEVVGAPWRSKRPGRDLMAEALEQLTPAPEGTIRIGLGHGAVSTLDPNRESSATIEVDSLAAAIAEKKVHVVILGDRHGTYEVAPRVWYPGTPEVTHRREIDPGNVLVVDIDVETGEVAVEKHPVGTWWFLTVEYQLDSTDDVAALRQRLLDLPDKDTTALWLALQGTLSITEHAGLQDALDEAAQLFARIDHWERHTDLVVIPDDHDFADLQLSGFAQDAKAELIQKVESDGEESGVAQDALELLYRLARGAS